MISKLHRMKILHLLRLAFVFLFHSSALSHKEAKKATAAATSPPIKFKSTNVHIESDHNVPTHQIIRHHSGNNPFSRIRDVVDVGPLVHVIAPPVFIRATFQTIELLRGGASASASGGASNDSSSLELPDLDDLENDDFLDAFVEELIANVDEEDQDDRVDDVNDEHDHSYNIEPTVLDNEHDQEEMDSTLDTDIKKDDITVKDATIDHNDHRNYMQIEHNQNHDIDENDDDVDVDVDSKTHNDENEESNEKLESSILIPQLSKERKKKKQSGTKKRRRKKQHHASQSKSKSEQERDEKQQERDEKISMPTETDDNSSTDINTTSTPTSITKSSSSPSSPSQQQHKIKIRTIQPPSPIQKFLLHKGQIGRSITTFTILLYEFLSYYIPTELQSMIAFIIHKTIPKRIRNHFDSNHSRLVSNSSLRRKDTHMKDKKKNVINVSIPKLNPRYQGLGNSNKLTEEQQQKQDEIAMEKLRRIGVKDKDRNNSSGGDSGSTGVDIGEYNDGGIYTHLSLRFMKKYNLGHFAQEKKMFDDMIGVLGDDLQVKERYDNELEEDYDGGMIISDIDEGIIEKGQETARVANKRGIEEESDDDWVAQAFLLDTNDGDDNEMIGSDDFYGDFEKDREMRKNLDIILEAAYASKSISMKKNNKGGKIFKQDGTSGSVGGGSSSSNNMFDRLRAAAETNGVSSRRIFGAYPGDAAAIEDAASANGVIDIATKYGYGDWSDEEESDEFVGVFGSGNNRRRRKKRITKTRKLSKPSGRTQRATTSKYDRRHHNRHDRKDGLSFSIELGANSRRSISSSSIKQRKRKLQSRSRIGDGTKTFKTKESKSDDIGITPRNKSQGRSIEKSTSPTSASDSAPKHGSTSLASRQRDLLQNGVEARMGSRSTTKKKRRRRKEKDNE